VTVIDLPADPMEYERTLRDAPVFERLVISSEDPQRGRHYADQRLREDMRQRAVSVEAFLRGLDMQVDIEPVAPATIARTAQLTQKTNQFNLTTRRYTESDIEGFIDDPASRVWVARAADRFGDSGIVGVVITRPERSAHVIDTFLLSCRVIGRTIETAVLAFLAARAHSAGARELVGEFAPTKKNAPAQALYRSHGFEAVTEEGDVSRWRLALTDASIPRTPPWLNVRIAQRT
jgi:FkbH-like protein